MDITAYMRPKAQIVNNFRVCSKMPKFAGASTLTPLIANDVKGIIIGVIIVLQVTYKGIQMVKSKEDTSAIMTLTLLHHENVNQCINTILATELDFTDAW